MLWNMIRLECKKAICHKFFWLVILIGITITFFSLVPMAGGYYRGMEDHQRISAEFGLCNPLMPIFTLFRYWIGGEGYTSGATQYFFLFPLLITIPYGWSYCIERKSGYIKNMVIRSGRIQYHLAKYIALFLSGGLAMVIPLLFNFLLSAMFVPAVMPDPAYPTSYAVGPHSLLSMCFFSHPFLYVFFYLLVDFVFCGLIACLCFAVSMFVKNFVVVVLLPFFILLGFNYFCYSLIYTSVTEIYTEWSPMHFLNPSPGVYNTNWIVIFVWGVVLFLFTFLMTVVRGARHEIY